MASIQSEAELTLILWHCWRWLKTQGSRSRRFWPTFHFYERNSDGWFRPEVWSTETTRYVNHTSPAKSTNCHSCELQLLLGTSSPECRLSISWLGVEAPEVPETGMKSIRNWRAFKTVENSYFLYKYKILNKFKILNKCKILNAKQLQFTLYRNIEKKWLIVPTTYYCHCQTCNSFLVVYYFKWLSTDRFIL